MKRIEIDLEKMKELYKSGKTSRQCAEIFNVSAHVILDRLKEMNIKKREPHIFKKGHKLSMETRKKMSEARMRYDQRGEKNCNWKGGLWHSHESWLYDPIIRKCYMVVRTAKRAGRLITQQPCELCGKAFAHAHHDDYRKPLEVRWLCVKHHGTFHKSHIMKDYKYIEA